MADCEDLGSREIEVSEGVWKGRVDGSGGRWSELSFGHGRVASLKRRPLQTQARQWNGTTTRYIGASNMKTSQ
jgi:hypothetical protein